MSLAQPDHFTCFLTLACELPQWERGGSDAIRPKPKGNHKQAHIRLTYAALEHLDALTLTYELPASWDHSPCVLRCWRSRTAYVSYG